MKTPDPNNNEFFPVGDDPLYYTQDEIEDERAAENALAQSAHRVFPQVQMEAARRIMARLRGYTPEMLLNLALYLQDVQVIVDALIPEHIDVGALHYLAYEQDWMIGQQPVNVDALVNAYISVNAWMTPHALMVMNARERLGGFLIDRKEAFLEEIQKEFL